MTSEAVLFGYNKAPPINGGVDVVENVTCTVCSYIGKYKASSPHCSHYGNIGVVTNVIGDFCCRFNEPVHGYAYPPGLHSHCLLPRLVDE